MGLGARASKKKGEKEREKDRHPHNIGKPQGGLSAPGKKKASCTFQSRLRWVPGKKIWQKKTRGRRAWFYFLPADPMFTGGRLGQESGNDWSIQGFEKGGESGGNTVHEEEGRHFLNRQVETIDQAKKLRGRVGVGIN